MRVVLARFDAEATHRATMRLAHALLALPGLRRLVARVLAPRDPALVVDAMGLRFPSPLGLAAGFDKDGLWFEDLLALGFGSVEVGTVTPRPQPGNARPRIVRLPADRALVNRMGFPNDGAPAAATRLGRRPGRAPVGVNIGRNKDTAAGDAPQDYAAAAAAVAGCADYLVINVSSPNTPGLRDLQAAGALRAVVVAVQDALAASGAAPPLLVKVSPDSADEDLLAVADTALECGIAGIVAVNTTVGRERLASTGAEIGAAGAGGLSGPPLRDRALEVLELLRGRVGDRLALVSVGGIATSQDAYERLRAGATLVQAYTAFVYGGPLWAWRMNRGLADLLRAKTAANGAFRPA